MADKVHCIRKTLRLMPEEAKMLAKKACDNRMNEAEYIRLLISQKPNDYPEVRKLLKELINGRTPSPTEKKDCFRQKPHTSTRFPESPYEEEALRWYQHGSKGLYNLRL